MNSVTVGLSIVEILASSFKNRESKRQALRDKYNKLVQEEKENDNQA